MAYRSSTGDLGHFDEPRRPRPAERWDREKFERYRSRGPEERESFSFEEREHYGGRRDHRDFEFEERFDRRRPVAVIERERFIERDVGSRPSRRRTDIFEEPSRAEVANQALTPYRRKSIIERDVDIDVQSRRSARPQFIRRQSSLDTFDRRPLPRYGDRERDEWRPPVNTPIPLPIRERPSRRVSPPRDTYDREVDYEASFRYRDTEPDHRDEDYRDVHVSRERSVKRQSSRAPSSSHRTVRSERSSTESFEEISPPPPVPQLGKRGKTRMPKRLVHHKAITELGVTFEEEGDFYVVQRALEKEHIDEIIKNSDKYKETRTTYRYEENKVVEAPASIAPPPPPPPPPVPEPVLVAPPPPPPPPPMSVHSHHSHHTHHTHQSQHTHKSHHSPSRAPASVALSSVRSSSPSQHTVIEERIEESGPIGGPLTLVRTDRPARSDREIKQEIRALEAERQLLRSERDVEYEFIERRPREREVLRVEKDRKGTDARILAAMVSTLT